MKKAIQEIATIIQRDSKNTTYKFALLKATIEIIQEYDHFAAIRKGRVTFPLGLIILKWLEYYYPIFEFHQFVPQKKADSKQKSLAFRQLFNELIERYHSGLGYLQLEKDLITGDLDEKTSVLIFQLIRKLRDTIVKMPMTYIRGNTNERNEVFQYNKDSDNRKRPGNLNTEYIINSSGTFSIPIDYYEGFKIMGSFISGKDSLIIEWLNFTIKADSKGGLNRGDVLALLDPNYSRERYVRDTERFFKNIKSKEELICVWSGQKIRKLNIDHVIPYSLWHNNDLWNLLPTSDKVNAKKRDQIISPDFLKKQKELVIYYWELLNEGYPKRFQNELNISLLGYENNQSSNWQNAAFNSLLKKCIFLVEERGHEPFYL